MFHGEMIVSLELQVLHIMLTVLLECINLLVTIYDYTYM